MEERHPIWKVVANIVNKQLGKPMKFCPPARSVCELLTIPQILNCRRYKHIHVSRTARISLYKMRNGERACVWATAM
jgi:hypothetical protein